MAGRQEQDEADDGDGQYEGQRAVQPTSYGTADGQPGFLPGGTDGSDRSGGRVRPGRSDGIGGTG